MWRAVLNWARHQADVPQTKNVQLWCEGERQRVCRALAGVINHVRLLLIDSQVNLLKIDNLQLIFSIFILI